MKNRDNYLLIYIILATAFLLQTKIIAMDTTPACPEQRLIDAIKSTQKTDAILRSFFIAPYADPNDITTIDYQDTDGNTLLMVAVAQNRTEIVEKIIRDYSPRLAVKNKSGKHIMQLCDENNGTPDEKNMIKSYILTLALSVCEELCRKKTLNQLQLQEVAFILGLLHEEKYNNRLSALLTQSIKNCNDDVTCLLAKALHIPVEQAIFRFLDSKICIQSAKTDSFATLEFETLVNHYRQYINYKTSSGYTLLSNAICNQQVDAVRILLKAGANPNDTVETNTQKIPLITLASTSASQDDKKWEIVRMLLDHGADINTNVEGYPPVLWQVISKYNKYPTKPLLWLINVPKIDLNITHEGKSFITFITTLSPKPSCTKSDIIDILQIVLIKLCLGKVDSVENQLADAVCQLSNDLCTIYNDLLRTQDIEVVKKIQNFDSKKCIFRKIMELGGPNIDLSDPKYCEAVYRLSPLLDNTDDIFKQDRAFAHEYAKTLIRNISQSGGKQYLDLLKRTIYKDKSLGLFKALYEGSLPYYSDIIDLIKLKIPIKISMMAACIDYNFAAGVKYLCECDDMNIIEEYIDGLETTPLIYALKKGSFACVQELINHRCNPNPPSFKIISYTNGTEKRVPSEGIAIATAKQYCPQAVALLQQAQATTVYDLPVDIIRKIIGHVPSGSSIKERFRSVITAAACGHLTHDSMKIGFSEGKNYSEIQDQKLSTLYYATIQASDSEKEAMLWNILNGGDFLSNNSYKRVSLLLQWYPHLINSCDPKTKCNLIASLFLKESLPSLDLVAQLIMTDKQINKTETSTLINAKTNAILRIDLGYYVYFLSYSPAAIHNDSHVGLSAMDILLYKLTEPYLQESNDALRRKETELKALVEYLVAQGGYFSTETYYSNPPAPSLQIQYEVGANSTLSIIIPLMLRANTVNIDRLELFLRGSKIDINAHQIQKGKNALHWAAALSNRSPLLSARLLEWLIQVPTIDINRLSTEGKTALDYLLNSGEHDTACLNLLQRKNAKTSTQLAEELVRKSRENADSAPQTNPGSSPQSTNPQQLAIVSAPAPAPVPGGSQSTSYHYWYTSPSWLWFAAAAACTGIICGTYNYLYPSDDAVVDDEQETGLDAVAHIQK